MNTLTDRPPDWLTDSHTDMWWLTNQYRSAGNKTIFFVHNCLIIHIYARILSYKMTHKIKWFCDFDLPMYVISSTYLIPPSIQWDMWDYITLAAPYYIFTVQSNAESFVYHKKLSSFISHISYPLYYKILRLCCDFEYSKIYIELLSISECQWSAWKPMYFCLFVYSYYMIIPN